MEFTLQPVNEYVRDESGIGVRSNLLRKLLDTQHVAGTFQGVLDITTLGYFLHMCLGTVNSVQDAATTAYTHTFTVNNDIAALPTYSFVYKRGAAWRVARGVQVVSLEISVTKNGDFNVNGELLGIGEASISSQTPSYSERPQSNYLHGRYAQVFTQLISPGYLLLPHKTPEILPFQSITTRKLNLQLVPLIQQTFTPNNLGLKPALR